MCVFTNYLPDFNQLKWCVVLMDVYLLLGCICMAPFSSDWLQCSEHTVWLRHFVTPCGMIYEFFFLMFLAHTGELIKLYHGLVARSYSRDYGHTQYSPIVSSYVELGYINEYLAASSTHFMAITSSLSLSELLDVICTHTLCAPVYPYSWWRAQRLASPDSGLKKWQCQ